MPKAALASQAADSAAWVADAARLGVGLRWGRGVGRGRVEVVVMVDVGGRSVGVGGTKTRREGLSPAMGRQAARSRMSRMDSAKA